MRASTALITAALALSLVTSALGATVVIPRYTVIPVVLQNSLSSATAQLGDRFEATCSGGNCGGFPNGTAFVGKVTGVTRAAKNRPGQLDVKFVQARLPNDARVNIDGTLTSLDKRDVQVDPNTGLLTQRKETRSQRNKFIAYGAGTGLLIGALSGGNWFKGALIGAAAGYLGGTLLGKHAVARNVDVPAGTEFGIALNRSVRLRSSIASGAGGGPVPVYDGGTSINFAGRQPYTAPNGVLMVPLREAMNDLGIPFSYSPSTQTVTMTTDRGRVMNMVNSSVVYIGDTSEALAAPTRLVRGTLYVPQGFLTAVTGKTSSWHPDSGTLVVY